MQGASKRMREFTGLGLDILSKNYSIFTRFLFHQRKPNFLVSLWILLCIGFVGCTEKHVIPEPALHYFQQGNTAYESRDYHAAIWNYVRAINLDSET